METQIFKSYSDFLKRENKKINGVTQQFALGNTNYKSQNSTNNGCWNCSGCIGCKNCSYCSDCIDCSGCIDCSDCSGCKNCSYCSGCIGCIGKKGNEDEVKSFPDIPVIPNIHQSILQAVLQENALNMDSWHTCDTTHCRAGWVVQLAGIAGKELEDATNTPFAAMMIYKKSSDIKVSPVRFYEENDVAMADIKRCAELEAENGK